MALQTSLVDFPWRLFSTAEMKSKHFYLGCPVWACPHWKGTVYSASAARHRWLAEYSNTFNTVEGNSTFYGIPSEDTFRRWADETADGFRFVLKFPRIISHENELIGAAPELDLFLNGLAVLKEAHRLGPTFLQLSPTFSPQKFGRLEKFLRSLPVQFNFAVEVRHYDFFQPSVEKEFNHLLKELAIDRVIFDSRPLYSAPPEDEIEEVSQQRKPKVPLRKEVTGRFPILRLIGRNRLELIQPWIDEWSETIADWIDSGLKPFVFTHAPDDQFAPEFARLFHNALSRRVKQLPQFRWMYEPEPHQLKLF